MLDATGCRHRVSIATDSSHWSYQQRFFCVFSSSTHRKKMRVYAKAPAFNKGMTHQFDEKDLTKLFEDFVGGIKLANFCLTA
jgi:hypothetical protein